VIGTTVRLRGGLLLSPSRPFVWPWLFHQGEEREGKRRFILSVVQYCAPFFLWVCSSHLRISRGTLKTGVQIFVKEQRLSTIRVFENIGRWHAVVIANMNCIAAGKLYLGQKRGVLIRGCISLDCKLMILCRSRGRGGRKTGPGSRGPYKKRAKQEGTTAVKTLPGKRGRGRPRKVADAGGGGTQAASQVDQVSLLSCLLFLPLDWGCWGLAWVGPIWDGLVGSKVDQLRGDLDGSLVGRPKSAVHALYRT